jgi:DNA polymerase-3 subunit epsilon
MRGLGAWIDRLRQARPAADPSRWIVVDLETSGLDSRHDHVLAIGAVALRAGRVAVSDSFEMLVRPPAASPRENILVHGIGAEAQLHASDPAEACSRFRDYIGTSPLAAFHAPFDEAFLTRCMRRSAGIRLANPWLDLADLAPALMPDARTASLDDWLVRFGIAPVRRHHPSCDAFVTAALFACLLQRLAPAEREFSALQARAARMRAARQGT